MSDAVQLALIAAFVTLAMAVLDHRAKARHREGEIRMDKIEHNTNSLVEQLVESTSKESFARGRKAQPKRKPKKK